MRQVQTQEKPLFKAQTGTFVSVYSEQWTLKDDIQTSKVNNSSLYKLIEMVKMTCLQF